MLAVIFTPYDWFIWKIVFSVSYRFKLNNARYLTVYMISLF